MRDICMRKIKFSVLIPVYNVENFLIECIESVRNQSYKNFEIILINDGSTDSSGAICDDYVTKDERIKVYHQKNQGLIMARRNAITKASGDFCFFLDSDDYWDSNLLETVNQTINEYDCDLVIYRYKRVTNKGMFISEAKSVFQDQTSFNRENKEELFSKIINSSDLNNLVCKAVKRSIIDNGDYTQYKEIKNAEDLLQSLPLLYTAEKIIYIDKPMYNYRVVSSSMTQTFNINLLRDITTVRGVLLQYLQKLQINNEENLKIFYQFYIKVFLNFIIDLVNSDIPKEKKIGIIIESQNSKLYIEAYNNINILKLSLGKKVLYYLLNNNHYKLLFVYARTVFFLIKIKRFV
jgi:glycosyltransferase involved in cell wall biosynthesis